MAELVHHCSPLSGRAFSLEKNCSKRVSPDPPESGLSILFLIDEALERRGVRIGLPRDDSTAFAAQTVARARPKMLLETANTLAC